MKIQEIILCEMATKLLPQQTGVDADVWISSNEFEGKKLPAGHPRRIKVKSGPGPTDWASVDIDTKQTSGTLPTHIKNQIIQFIRLNYMVLARIWEQGTDRERKWIKDIRKLPSAGWPTK